jgi:hypothetical protein
MDVYDKDVTAEELRRMRIQWLADQHQVLRCHRAGPDPPGVPV